MSSPLPALVEADAVQETLLGEALEHAPIGAIVLDEAGRYLAANRMACRLTGYTREELLDAGPRALAAEPEKVPAALEQMASGALEHGTASMRYRDGTLIDVEYRVGATRSGGLPYFVLVFWELERAAT
jgi:PAS domain S-box-containing protein